jgi:hypothetical protein
MANTDTDAAGGAAAEPPNAQPEPRNPNDPPHRVGRFTVEPGLKGEAPLNTLSPAPRIVFSA